MLGVIFADIEASGYFTYIRNLNWKFLIPIKLFIIMMFYNSDKMSNS